VIGITSQIQSEGGGNDGVGFAVPSNTVKSIASQLITGGKVIPLAYSGPTRLASLRQRRHGFERWLLAERSKPPISVLILAWPPNHATPVHDHAGLWGLEMTLVGALEVQSYRRDADSGELSLHGRNWLGPGDGVWFEGDRGHAHRCRNLSRHDTALSLHVYGGDLAEYFAYEQAEPTGRWVAQPQRSVIAGRLPG